MFPPLKVKEGRWRVPNVTAGVLRLWYTGRPGAKTPVPNRRGQERGLPHSLPHRGAGGPASPEQSLECWPIPSPGFHLPPVPTRWWWRNRWWESTASFQPLPPMPTLPPPIPKPFVLVNQRTGSKAAAACRQKVGREPGRWHGPEIQLHELLIYSIIILCLCHARCTAELQENKKTYTPFLPLARSS